MLNHWTCTNFRVAYDPVNADRGGSWLWMKNSSHYVYTTKCEQSLFLWSNSRLINDTYLILTNPTKFLAWATNHNARYRILLQQSKKKPSLASFCATQGEFAENSSKNLLAALSTTTPPPVFLKLLSIREHLCNFSTTLFTCFCYDKVVQFGDFHTFGQGIGYTERSLEKSSTPRSNVISRTSSLKCNVPWTNSWLPTRSIVYRK